MQCRLLRCTIIFHNFNKLSGKLSLLFFGFQPPRDFYARGQRHRSQHAVRPRPREYKLEFRCQTREPPQKKKVLNQDRTCDLGSEKHQAMSIKPRSTSTHFAHRRTVFVLQVRKRQSIREHVVRAKLRLALLHNIIGIRFHCVAFGLQ